MNGWKAFVAGKIQEVMLDDPTSERIVKRLGVDLEGFFSKTDGARTKHNMDALSLLGDSGLIESPPMFRNPQFFVFDKLSA